MDGLDLVPLVTSAQRYGWDETTWEPGRATAARATVEASRRRHRLRREAQHPAPSRAGRLQGHGRARRPPSADDVLALKPDGVFLSNGPGDPAATGEYAVPVIRTLLDRSVPTFGICLGHQMLGLAVGGRTMKMHQGHHGANHPVKDKTTGKVEITSMNHGFAVDPESLPATAVETHVSLFDGSNCGIALTDRPAFSVQYHPEASPGPQDSHYLFDRFVKLIEDEKALKPRLKRTRPSKMSGCGARRPKSR